MQSVIANDKDIFDSMILLVPCRFCQAELFARVDDVIGQDKSVAEQVLGKEQKR